MQQSGNLAPHASKNGTWAKALRELGLAALVILSIRWVILEPFVIPSGSMRPSLLELDYILVNKFAYGVRWPLSQSWIFHSHNPEFCETTVFKSKQDAGTTLIKRALGLAGDHLILYKDGTLARNGTRLRLRPALKTEVPDLNEENLRAYIEECEPGRGHLVFLSSEFSGEDLGDGTLRSLEREIEFEITVPPGELVFFGDNRNHSLDSRVWGSASQDLLIGRAQRIWLSCANGLPDMAHICDPSSMRTDRIGRRVDPAFSFPIDLQRGDYEKQ